MKSKSRSINIKLETIQLFKFITPIVWWIIAIYLVKHWQTIQVAVSGCAITPKQIKL
jgi:hypothetical protein